MLFVQSIFEEGSIREEGISYIVGDTDDFDKAVATISDLQRAEKLGLKVYGYSSGKVDLTWYKKADREALLLLQKCLHKFNRQRRDPSARLKEAIDIFHDIMQSNRYYVYKDKIADLYLIASSPKGSDSSNGDPYCWRMFEEWYTEDELCFNLGLGIHIEGLRLENNKLICDDNWLETLRAKSALLGPEILEDFLHAFGLKLDTNNKIILGAANTTPLVYLVEVITESISPEQLVHCKSIKYINAYYFMEHLVSDVSKVDVKNVQSMARLFHNYALPEIKGLENWNVSNVRKMTYMFSGARLVKQLDIENWDVSSAKNFEGMFLGCSSIESLDLNKWTVSEAENFADMFRCMTKLRHLNIKDWDVRKVKFFNNMFIDCICLESLDLSGWHPDSAQKMNDMFVHCKSLKEVRVSQDFIDAYKWLRTDDEIPDFFVVC